MEDQFTAIKKEVQLIIDYMAMKHFSQASIKLIEVSDRLDEMLDASNDEVVLREISKYQVLLNHLQIKMSTKQ
jgi:ribosomal protein S24E